MSRIFAALVFIVIFLALQGALNGASVLQQFLLANFDSDLRTNMNRVVIFLGGNDLNNNYTTYYNGADPSAFIASLPQ